MLFTLPPSRMSSFLSSCNDLYVFSFEENMILSQNRCFQTAEKSQATNKQSTKKRLAQNAVFSLPPVGQTITVLLVPVQAVPRWQDSFTALFIKNRLRGLCFQATKADWYIKWPKRFVSRSTKHSNTTNEETQLWEQIGNHNEKSATRSSVFLSHGWTFCLTVVKHCCSNRA